jgi:hypothetical protein
MSPGCALRPLRSAFTGLVAEVGNFVRDVGSSFCSASRRDQQADSHADPNSDEQSNGFAEYLRIFFATKRVSGLMGCDGAVELVEGG